ncbi:MAG: hypothetical protein ABSE59_01610 [Opitutaceae bacterium]
MKLSAPSEPAAPKFSEAQLSRVSGWMRDLAPSCPPAAVAAAAQHFLEELQWREPDKMERLLTGGVTAADFQSMLLRHLAVQLPGSAQASLREQLAGRRVQVLLGAENPSSPATPQAATVVLGKLKTYYQAYYRQLLEGHIDDDDLVPLLTEARRAGTAAAQPTQAKPQELTADDILAAFSTHNQKNLALQNLRAYKIEGTLTDMKGKEQHLLLFKLRPDRFRMHVVVGGATRYILANDGTKFWQVVPGAQAQVARKEALGTRRYLTEFINPLFSELDNYTYERLADGTLDSAKVYRLAVHRPDGSQYVACLDPDTFHEVCDEYGPSIRVRYSDFREVAGLTMAFREETTDTKGGKAVFVLEKFSANPGLIQEFFETAPGRDANYFIFEKLLASAPAADAATQASAH